MEPSPQVQAGTDALQEALQCFERSRQQDADARRALDCLREGLAHLKGQHPSPDLLRLRARLLVREGNLCARLGDGLRTEESGREALAWLAGLDEPLGEAHAWNHVGLGLLRQGRLAEARDPLERGLELLPGPGTPVERSLLGSLAEVHLECGRWTESRRLAARLRRLAREVEDLQRVGMSLHLEATAAAEEGDAEEARARFQQAMEIFREGGWSGSLAASLVNLGNLLARLGEHGRALACFDEALELQQDAEMRHVEPAALLSISALLNRIGDHAEAGERAQEGLEIVRRTGGGGRFEAEALVDLAEARLGEGEAAAALVDAELALELATAAGHRGARSDATCVLAVACLATGDPERALGLLRTLEGDLADAGSDWRLAVARALTAEAVLALGRLDEAREAAEAAVALVEDPALEARACATLATVLERQGDPEAALRFTRRQLELLEQSARRDAAARLERWLARNELTRSQLQRLDAERNEARRSEAELRSIRLELTEALEEVRRLKGKLEAENVHLREELESVKGFEGLVGRSTALRAVLHRVERVASTETSVLLLGETGTGKELLARALHANSKRAAEQFVPINCAALPATLIESELFGHEKGAFTGATSRRVGRFELADGGTLFLDEVGDLPLDLQVKLLRVLQTGEYQRLGSSRTRRADVRIVAATNRPLEAMVESGEFREDLYFRLSVFPIEVPPLRERRDDIPLLAWYFVTKKQGRVGKHFAQISAELMDAFTGYDWPGNVRELENVVERTLILSTPPLLELVQPLRPPGRASGLASERLEDVERDHLRQVLASCGWRVKGTGNAAERLGLNPSTLRYRMKKLGIERPAGPEPR